MRFNEQERENIHRNAAVIVSGLQRPESWLTTRQEMAFEIMELVRERDEALADAERLQDENEAYRGREALAQAKINALQFGKDQLKSRIEQLQKELVQSETKNDELFNMLDTEQDKSRRLQEALDRDLSKAFQREASNETLRRLFTPPAGVGELSAVLEENERLRAEISELRAARTPVAAYFAEGHGRRESFEAAVCDDGTAWTRSGSTEWKWVQDDDLIPGTRAAIESEVRP